MARTIIASPFKGTLGECYVFLDNILKGTIADRIWKAINNGIVPFMDGAFATCL